jgi:hypothetical protein
VNFRASFNPQPLKKKLQNRVRGFQATLPEQLRRAGRLVAVSLATSAQPYGLDGGARKRGESAAAADVLRCYATPADVWKAFPEKKWASIFWAQIKRSDWSRAQKTMQEHCPEFRNKEIRPFDGGAAHRANRNSRGHVSKKQTPVFVVQTPRDLFAYVQHEKDEVGFGKDGWGSCAKSLGGTAGLPQWVTRHKAPASVIENQDKERPSITLRNNVTYAKQILTETDKQIALRIGLDRLSKALFTEERALARANALS